MCRPRQSQDFLFVRGMFAGTLSPQPMDSRTDGVLTSLARIDSNRGRGTWKSTGPRQIEFGPLALTRARCAPGSLHDQIVSSGATSVRT